MKLSLFTAGKVVGENSVIRAFFAVDIITSFKQIYSIFHKSFDPFLANVPTV